MNTVIYKITKIVRMLWLAERSVCMKECKHGCDVKMFCFSLSKLSHKHKFEKVFEFKTWQVYFICWFLRCFKTLWHSVAIFFRLSWHFKREKSVFWTASFGKKRTDYACKTSLLCKTLWLVRISLWISAITKSFAFFLGKVIL